MKHHELRTHVKTVLGSHILDLYSQGIFGRASRMDIDLAAFKALLKLYLAEVESPAYSPEWDSIDWYLITRSEIADFASTLCLSENRTQSLIEKCALSDALPALSDDEAIALIEELLEMSDLKEGDLINGKVTLYVPNALTRKAIVEYLARRGHLSRLNYHGDVLVLCLVDVISLFHCYNVELEILDQLTQEELSASENYINRISYQQNRNLQVLLDELISRIKEGSCFTNLLQSLPDLIASMNARS